jgi:hypothetical protein
VAKYPHHAFSLLYLSKALNQTGAFAEAEIYREKAREAFRDEQWRKLALEIDESLLEDLDDVSVV